MKFTTFILLIVLTVFLSVYPGRWSSGEPNPGNPSLVSLPGDELDNFLRVLTLQFQGMTPHVGQRLEIRVVDKASRLEVGRTEVSSIPSAYFSVPMDVVIDGGYYWVDFYVDVNGNGVYDSPPVDHAWRLDLDNVQG